jgi:DNA repair protein RecO (recombination protein O)
VSSYRDEGIVLRTHKLGEADRIITLLTRRNGRVRAVAKGVRRTMSRFGARLEPFTHVDMQIHEGRSLDVITQAETVRPYGEPFAADYPRYTAGTAMLETAERLTPVEKEPALRQFLLLVGGLRTLGEVAHDPRMVLDAYLLRSLALAGYAPALEECARCGTRTGNGGAGATPGISAGRPGGTPEGSSGAAGGFGGAAGGFGGAAGGSAVGAEGSAGGRGSTGGRPRAFAIAAGGLVCGSCRPPGAVSPAGQTVALMRALLRGDWVYADASDARHRVECSGLVAAYLQWHLEHSIRSLRLVERA